MYAQFGALYRWCYKMKIRSLVISIKRLYLYTIDIQV